MANEKIQRNIGIMNSMLDIIAKQKNIDTESIEFRNAKKILKQLKGIEEGESGYRTYTDVFESAKKAHAELNDTNKAGPECVSWFNFLSGITSKQRIDHPSDIRHSLKEATNTRERALLLLEKIQKIDKPVIKLRPGVSGDELQMARETKASLKEIEEWQKSGLSWKKWVENKNKKITEQKERAAAVKNLTNDWEDE